MRRTPSLLCLLALATGLAGCSTNAEWRRANRSADWLLTKVAALKRFDRLNTSNNAVLEDLERERLDLELLIKAYQADGRDAVRDGDEPGLQQVIGRFEGLEKKYDTLREKYSNADG